MKVAFIKNDVVQKAIPIQSFIDIGRENFRRDWQRIKEVSDEVVAGWVYDEETDEVSAP